jgi:predicted phage-related endonuclease
MAAVATESKVVAKVEIERTVVALDDYADLINEYAEARDLRNELDKKVKALNARLDEVMGDAEAGTVAGRVRITVTEVDRESIDTKVLAEIYPEAYENTRKVTRYKKRNLK